MESEVSCICVKPSECGVGEDGEGCTVEAQWSIAFQIRLKSASVLPTRSFLACFVPTGSIEPVYIVPYV